MALPNDYPAFDASNMPELIRWIQEVNDTRTPRTIKIGESAVAVLIPAQEENLQHAARTKEERWRIVMSAAGSWSDVDTDKLKEDIYAARDLDSRPRIDL